MGTRLVFKHTIEGLFGRDFESVLTPELRAQMATLGLNLSRIEPTLDAATYGACYELLRAAAYPGLPPDEAGVLMGKRFLDGYFSTAIGSVVRTLLKFLPVDKVVERAPQNLMSGTNFIQARVEKRGPRVYEVWMSDYSTSPQFLQGVMTRMLEVSGAKDVDVKLVAREGRALRFLLSWR